MTRPYGCWLKPISIISIIRNTERKGEHPMGFVKEDALLENITPEMIRGL